MSKHADIVIIGAGVIGLMTARELALGGARVLLADRPCQGKPASWAGGGILSPLYPWRWSAPLTALAAIGQQRYPDLCRELEASTGLPVECRQTGLLVLDEPVEPALEWATAEQKNCLAWSPQAVADKVPALGLTPESALWMPDISQIRNPRLLRALRADVLARGVELREDCDVSGLYTKGHRVLGVETSEGRLLAGKTVVTAGPWSNQLVREGISVKPVRGQMIQFAADPDLLGPMVLRDDHYLIPRADGRILMGSTLEQAGFENLPTDEARAQLQALAIEMVPALGDCAISAHWSGLRPDSGRETPWIGPHPDLEDLYLNCGHFRNGLVLAPGSAKIVKEQILGESPSLDADAFSLTLAA